MAELETVKIYNPKLPVSNLTESVNINKSDFDPDKHELFGSRKLQLKAVQESEEKTETEKPARKVRRSQD